MDTNLREDDSAWQSAGTKLFDAKVSYVAFLEKKARKNGCLPTAFFFLLPLFI